MPKKRVMEDEPILFFGKSCNIFVVETVEGNNAKQNEPGDYCRSGCVWPGEGDQKVSS